MSPVCHLIFALFSASIFTSDFPGYMVGSKAEKGGIAKDGRLIVLDIMLFT